MSTRFEDLKTCTIIFYFENVKNVELFGWNLIFIKIERRKMVIDQSVKLVVGKFVRSIVMIFTIEY